MVKKKDSSKAARDFLAETEDILNKLGKGLVHLEKSYKAGSVTPSMVNGIFRDAHTLKGVCGVYGFDKMVSVSNAMEDAFDSLRIGRVILTDDLLGALIRAYALLTKMTTSKEDVDFTDEIDAITAFLKKTEVTRLGRRKEDHVDSKLLSMLTDYEENKLFESIKAGAKILLLENDFALTTFDNEYDAFAKLLEPDVEMIATLPSKKKPVDGSIKLQILIASKKNIDILEARFDTKCEVVYSEDIRKQVKVFKKDETHSISENFLNAQMDATVDDETLKSGANSVRVDISKLDHVMSIVGELGLLRADLTRLARDIKKEMPYSSQAFELIRIEKHLDRRFSELRDSVLDVRLVQIGQLFVRYETMLSMLCRKTGKEVKMETFGAETEIDKLMVEELADPIMHMIRNVVDHAIEPPEEREKLGKDRTGTISFSAYQKGNRVVVEVCDDGRGIDVEMIADKAVKKGLVTKKYVDNLSSTEKMDLIFLPGFTTTDQVGDVSGRGVGLDVVKENIASLSGAIEIETVKGQGTRFILTIPITLAITEALIVEDAGDRYALPLNTVSEVITIDPKEIFVQDGHEVIKILERTVPVARLCTVMGTKCAETNGNLIHGVMAGIAEHRLCIVAEKIIEQLDVVIKPISSSIKLSGIAGATDLGMGEKGTILVLDVRDILESLLKEKSGLQVSNKVTNGPVMEVLH
ncbi:MAG: chemotaxis protein CheA [Proteobacteria bacterium]|nr:chemotaxis protein CheA [Pseudomonadota bacterium]